MTPIVLALPGNDALAAGLAAGLDAELGRVVVRPFPDGESYVRIESEVAARPVILACTLDRPDAKLMPLLLLAATARDLGAARVGLVAPYLGYLRQDRRFLPGEGVTSVYFARLLSDALHWLVTMDPHLHRHHSLADVYTIPARALRSAPAIAAWLRTAVPDAVVVGPDRESEQWVADVATRAGVPYLVLEKIRRGDREVEVSLPAGGTLGHRTPVLVDDVISSGRTMLATIAELRRLGTPAPICVAVHAVFADGAHDDVLAAGAARVVTCNTIAHPSNRVDVGTLLADGVRSMLET